MMYLIGLGLNQGGISQEGLDIIKKCKKIYLENYTVEFPYSVKELEEVIEKKITVVDRCFVEGFKIIEEAKKADVALLVYGSPLTATTHISLIQEAEKSNLKYRILFNASILDAVAETGLQLYKLGKTASMPKWDKEKNYTPDSFIEIIRDNQSINAHTLLLIDIGLYFQEALKQLEISTKNKKLKLKKIIICQMLGTKKQRIIYSEIERIKKDKIKNPFCIIIPAKLHFIEKEVLEKFRIDKI